MISVYITPATTSTGRDISYAIAVPWGGGITANTNPVCIPACWADRRYQSLSTTSTGRDISYAVAVPWGGRIASNMVCRQGVHNN